MPETNATPLLHDQPFNINQFVKVRLTEYGRKVYLTRTKLNKGGKPSEIKEQLAESTDSSGYTTFQLYMLIAIFGRSMPDYATSNRGGVPFEPEIILLADPLDVLYSELTSPPST